MSPHKGICSHESLEGAKSIRIASPAQLEATTMMPSPTSPDNASTPPNNPLRRSLILRLDQERREKGEAMENEVCTERQATGNEVFLPRCDLLEALDLDLDSSHHRRQIPKLRLRPVKSQDMDEYCATCGGNTAPFQTPRDRSSAVPPRNRNTNANQSSTVPLACQCHATGTMNTAATTPQYTELPTGPRLSFLHMASPTQNQQLLVANTNDRKNISESLQLWLDDEDSEDDVNGKLNNRNGQSAFRRRRVVLQPKAVIQRCHSDPADKYTDIIQPQKEPTSSHSAPDRHLPGLVDSSSGSSSNTSPEDQVHSLLHCRQGSIGATSSAFSVTIPSQQELPGITPSQQEQQHQHQGESNNTNGDSEEEEERIPMPLLPTMTTPEMIRPLFRGITLAPNPKGSTETILLQDLPAPPTTHSEDSRHK